MTSESTLVDPPETPERVAKEGFSTRRVIGDLSAAADGPTLLTVGSLHGNEPAGALALERVVRALSPATGEASGLVRGRLVALTGNLEAMARGSRWVDRDLNRGWYRECFERIRRGELETVEDREMLELSRIVDRVVDETASLPVVVDLHTTSGGGPPFVNVSNRTGALRLASCLPLPKVVGIDAHLLGTWLDWCEERGMTGIGLEGGQHRDPHSVDHLEAALWIVLEALEMVSDFDEGTGRRLRDAHELLERAGRHLPPFVRIRFRQPIEPGKPFQMEPGHDHFAPVTAGAVLAHDEHGPVRAPIAGRILMPLYQSQGQDGFFLVEEIPTPASLLADDSSF